MMVVAKKISSDSSSSSNILSNRNIYVQHK